MYDGQQRLATTTILISAIRDYFLRVKDPISATTIETDFLRSVDRKTHEARPHLRLNVDDHQFFLDRILRSPIEQERVSAKPDPKKDSHALIEKAAQIAADYVRALAAALPAADAKTLLHKWLDYLSTSARVIWVEVANEPMAYRVFETMNDRGLKLSAADLLKNFLFAMAGGRKAEVVQRWQSMVATLESLGRVDGDVVDYIRYYWITTHGPTRVSELFDEIKAEVSSEAGAVSFMSALESRATAYAAILTPSHDTWSTYHQEVRAHIDTLRYLGVSQLRPILLAAVDKFTKGELEKLFKVALSWSVRFLVTGVSSGTLERFYSRTAKQITDDAIRNVAAVLRELAPVLPEDEVFKAAFSRVSVPTASLARYYLRRLQIQADGNNEPQYTPNDGKAVTLEHVLPQRPGQEWQYIVVEVAQANYNRIGNQALLAGSVNSRLGNIGFSAKKPALAASPFSLTAQIALEQRWDIQQILDRQEKLAELAVLAWPLS